MAVYNIYGFRRKELSNKGTKKSNRGRKRISSSDAIWLGYHYRKKGGRRAGERGRDERDAGGGRKGEGRSRHGDRRRKRKGGAQVATHYINYHIEVNRPKKGSN